MTYSLHTLLTIVAADRFFNHVRKTEEHQGENLLHFEMGTGGQTIVSLYL